MYVFGPVIYSETGCEWIFFHSALGRGG